MSTDFSHIKTVGIIGYGKFGALVRELVVRFAPHIQVRVHSSRFKPDNETFFSLEDTAQCDALVIASPIAAFEETLIRVLPLMCEDTIIVDVATVKMHTTKLLQKLAPSRPYLATHPMFGPESYEKKGKSVEGFRIVITEHTIPEAAYKALVSFLKTCGFVIIELSPDEHDKRLAETLFLTHFIGQIVVHGGFSRTDIDTASFGFLMDAVESVRYDTALFADVYRFDPYCEEMLKRFEKAELDVHALLKRAQ